MTILPYLLFPTPQNKKLLFEKEIFISSLIGRLVGVHYRHETPVLAKPIRVIHVDEDIVVLDKPGSLPVSDLN